LSPVGINHHTFQCYSIENNEEKWMNCTRPGKQLVRKAVQQEELKFLKTTLDTPKAIQQDSAVADLPDLVRQALLGMPHTNSRTTTKKWFEYYTQETLDRTYEMYQHDFEVFGYSPIMTQRPDLQPPALYLQQHAAKEEEEGACQPLETMIRDSSRSSMESQRSRRDALRRSSSASVADRQFISSMVAGGFSKSSDLLPSQLEQTDEGCETETTIPAAPHADLALNNKPAE
jgi:hypothetical protein